ncbi:hypothetical protein, partial [Sphaerothrix gracilis]|uniref:hypothetical protein n=1 Tax=Sphaerothrix gracilis TaxID=3151835 RepID=UPI0031FCDD4B
NPLDLSHLSWVKVIYDPSGWAYTRDRLKEMPQTIDFNHVTVFPLGFRTDKAYKLATTDQVALIQNGKLTHIVEILDSEPYEEGNWYNRLCRVLWWQPEVTDWSALPAQSELLGFDPALQDGDPHLIESLKRFGKRWSDNGKMAGFRAYLAERLQEK